MSSKIHPTAVISSKAEIDDDVTIEPYVVIDDNVKIGRNTVIGNHTSIGPNTSIGKNNKIYPHVSLGSDPQDLTFKGEDTYLEIGNDNLIREFVTMNRGTAKGRGVTRVGNNGMYMAYSHVAHDCIVGDNCFLTNMGTLGGHVVMEEWAGLGGMVVVHQFCRLGAHSFVGGVSGVTKDIPPYCIVDGRRAEIKSLNLVGLKRRGFSEEALKYLREAYNLLFRNKSDVFAVNLAKVEETLGHVPEVRHMLDFINSSERGIVH